MTARFGFQVTVQDRIIWIFPEDVNSADVAAKAEAYFKRIVAEQLVNNVNVFKTQAELDKFILGLPDSAIKKKIQDEIKNLTTSEKYADLTTDTEKLKAQVAVWVNNVSITEINQQIASITGDAKSRLAALQSQASTGITYGWKRSAGEDPISLGTFGNLLDFITNSIVKKLGLKFDVREEFDALVRGLPEPISGSVQALTDGAVFELDEIRLKIPGKGSTIPVKNPDGTPKKDDKGNPIVKPEPTQFEITMLINLLSLDLELGPFQLNRIYAKLGNFGKAEAAA